MSHLQQPETPVRRSKMALYAPMTPQTPSTAPKISKTAPNSARQPLSSYQNIAFTPPPALLRGPRTPLSLNKPHAVDSWRRPSGSVESPTRSVSNGTNLLPSAFISSQRRTSIRKPDSPVRVQQAEYNIWADTNSENSFSDGAEHRPRQSSLSIPRGVGLTGSAPLTPVRASAAYRGQSTTPHQSPVGASSASPSSSSCASCGSGSTDVKLSCAHVMCSGCFTSSLNIVGEKPFACPACSERILDFRFTSSPASKSSPREISHVNAPMMVAQPESSWNASPPLHEAFEDLSLDSLAVLRMDDVPWDVTPRMLGEWAGVPPQHAHVLLDRDGKTLSHAFIEAPPQAAREILVTCRNKVLGHGKRARRVTITATSQDELLQQLFPGWPGRFSDSRASLAGAAQSPSPLLNASILPLHELEILAKRILKPDTRYIKDASLPYYSLVSVLNKFPYDDDSRMFWNFGTRDTLYTIAYSAMMQLASGEREEWKQVVMRSLAAAVFRLPIFTSEQVQQVQALLEADNVSSTPAANIPAATFSDSTYSSALIDTPPPPGLGMGHDDQAYMYNPDAMAGAASHAWSPFDAIAEELGVEPHIVQAVCERLASCSLV